MAQGVAQTARFHIAIPRTVPQPPSTCDLPTPRTWLVIRTLLLYMPAVPSRRIVIVGAGFAGLAAARAVDAALLKADHDVFGATLVAAGPFGQLTPLLPGLISGWVEPWHLLVPLARSFRRVAWLPARLQSIDADSHRISVVRNGETHPTDLPFDHLVLATGARMSTHGVESAPGVLIGLRSTHDALAVRNRMAEMFTAASAQASARRRRALLTVVVVGGTTRGCAIALECAAYLRNACQHHPNVRPEDPRVVLLCPGDRVCEDLCLSDSARVASLLDQVGIEVWTAHWPVQASARSITVRPANGTGMHVDCGTIVWARDGAPATVLADRTDCLTPDGRVQVDDYLRVRGSPSVYAVGSAAAVLSPTGPACASRSVAHVISMVRMLADNLVVDARSQAVATRSPKLEAWALDRDWGLAVLGTKRLSGQAAACLARSQVLGVLPDWKQRQVVRASWMLGRLGVAGLSPRLQPNGLSSSV